MRDPDREATLARSAPALLWADVGEAVTAGLSIATGIPAEQLQAQLQAPALSDDELHVRAWRMQVTPRRPDHQASIAAWLINGPYHPFWRWWQLAIVHLRPIEGVKPAAIHRDGASHEIMILSIDPNHPPDIDELEQGEGHLRYLTPPDLVHQVVGLTDEQACELVDLMIGPILDGQLSPDRDFRSRWEPILETTAEHLRYGTHPALN